MPETIISSMSFWALMASFLRLVSSSRSSDDETRLTANDSKNYTVCATFIRSDVCGEEAKGGMDP